MPEKKTTEPTNPSNRQKSAKINTTSTAKPAAKPVVKSNPTTSAPKYVANRFGNQNTTDNTSVTPVINLPKKSVVTSTTNNSPDTFLDHVLGTSTSKKTTKKVST